VKNVGYIYAIAAAVSWGLVYALDQKILTKLTPLALTFFSALLISLVTLPFVLADQASLKSLLESDKAHMLLTVFSILITALATFFILSGIKLLGSPTASIFEIAYPFFVVLFSLILYKTTLNAYFFLGGILIFAGAFVIIRFS